MTPDDSNGQKPWIVHSQVMVAEFFGIPRRTVEEWVKSGMPGKRRHYDLSVIYGWLRARESKSIDSDALEWQRRERARLTQLKRLEVEGELVRVAEIEGALTAFAGIIRQAGDKLQRQYGADAGDLLNEAIDAAIESLGRIGTGGEKP